MLVLSRQSNPITLQHVIIPIYPILVHPLSIIIQLLLVDGAQEIGKEEFIDSFSGKRLDGLQFAIFIQTINTAFKRKQNADNIDESGRVIRPFMLKNCIQDEMVGDVQGEGSKRTSRINLS